MIDQIIEFNIMSPLLGDGYKAGGIGGIKTHQLVPKDIVVRGFIIDSETGELEEIEEQREQSQIRLSYAEWGGIRR